MYKNIIILTGAGISVESGIRTFRDQNGLWEQHKIEDVATPEAYMRNPTLVHEFYNARLDQLQNMDIQPNLAHLALAKLESEFDGQFLLLTQNIDDLHCRAGNKKIIYMHGELNKGRCPMTGQTFTLTEPFGTNNHCTCCIPSAVLRPHVVWFGEMPFGLDKIHHALETCDLFIAIGTSGSVYPAAGFVDIANQHGATTIEINLNKTETCAHFHYNVHGTASVEVPKLISKILDGTLSL